MESYKINLDKELYWWIGDTGEIIICKHILLIEKPSATQENYPKQYILINYKVFQSELFRAIVGEGNGLYTNL